MRIKRKLAASGIWMVLAAIVNNFSSIVIFIALARLLTPDQFGIVALAMIFIDLSRIIVGAGLPDALIQREEWDDCVASTAFWTNIIISLAAAIILGGIGAPAIGSIYGSTSAYVLLALSPTLVIHALSSIHVAKLRREFRHKDVAKHGLTANILSGVLGVALAYSGWGVWALVISRVIAASASSFILWRATGWRPKLTFSGAEFKRLASFSGHLLGSQLLSQANRHMPGFAIGLFLGPAALAQYRIGTRALSMIVGLVITPLQSAAMSAFSRVGKAERPLAYLRLTRSCSIVACPVFIGAGVIAIDFTNVVFGPQWVQGGYVMATLSANVAPSVLMYFAVPAFSAAGQTRLVLLSTGGMFIGTFLAALAAVAFGPVAVAGAHVALAHLTLPFSLLMLKRGIGVSRREAIMSIAPSFIAAVIMALVLIFIQNTYLESASRLERMALSILVGPIVYTGLLACFWRKFLMTVWGDLRPLLPVSTVIKKFRRRQ